MMRPILLGDRKGQFMLKGFAFLMFFFVIYVVAAGLIPVLNENLNAARDNTDLNCPGTAGFNQTDFDDDTDLQKLVRRPTCFATGLTTVYFFGAVMIAATMWVVAQWRKKK